MGKRIHWIDVARFLGIYFIFIGHFGDSAGYSFKYFYTFHVPMFFFLSGCTKNLSGGVIEQ